MNTFCCWENLTKEFCCHHSNLKICFILSCVSCFLNSSIFFRRLLRKTPEIEWIEWMKRNRNTDKEYRFCNTFFIWLLCKVPRRSYFFYHIPSAVNAPERNKKKCWQRGYKKYICNIWSIHAVAITFINSFCQFILQVL